MTAPSPQPPAGPQPAPPRPVRTSLVGPVWLTVGGALALVLALVVGVATAVLLVRTASTGVLGFDGRVGEEVVAEADAPGATTAELEAGERYTVHLVVPSGTSGELEEDVLLQAPSGDVVAADEAPGVSSRSSVGMWSVRSVSAFTAPETGTYTVAVPAADVDGARVLIAPDKAFVPFLGGVFGSVVGIFVAVGLLLLSLPLLVGGIVWWVVRARARSRAAVTA